MWASAIHFGIAVLLAALTLAGCASSPSSPTPSPLPSLTVSLSTTIASPSLSPTPTATPVPTPSPTRGPTGFSMTGNMNDSRAFFTATALLDGRVLLVGGMDRLGASTDYLATAEIYDPASGKFTLTGSMTGPRVFHASVRLTDGRVLIMGGVDFSGSTPDPLSSAELYDPATGTFTPTGSLPTGQWFGPGYGLGTSGGATLLPDGSVAAFGYSCDATGTCQPGAALYDPTTGTFSPGGGLASRDGAVPHATFGWFASQGDVVVGLRRHRSARRSGTCHRRSGTQCWRPELGLGARDRLAL